MRDMLNRISNIFVKPLLKSPLHGLVSGEFMLITFTGRKSGKTYSTPVQYKRDGQAVIFLTRKKRKWWRNLQGDAAVTVRIRGWDIEGTPEVVEDQTAIEQALRQMNPKITLEQMALHLPETVMVRLYLRQPELATAH